MTHLHKTGPLGLECVTIEINELIKQANLIAVAAQTGDHMDMRILPGICATAENVASRLGDATDRLDALMREWLAEQPRRRPATEEQT